jgi:hypothetical protein
MLACCLPGTRCAEDSAHYSNFLRSRRWTRSDTGFNPVARKMSASFTTDPNIVPDLLFRRRAQIEIDPRIGSSRFHRDRCFRCPGRRKTHFIETSWQSTGVVAVDISVADNGRDLPPFVLEPDLGSFKRPSVRACDISLDGGSLC